MPGMPEGSLKSRETQGLTETKVCGITQVQGGPDRNAYRPRSEGNILIKNINLL
jgi:hypothetical protein